MATYIKLKRKKGTVYRAVIRIKRKDFEHQESKTFSTKARAKVWAEAREKALEDPDTIHKAQQGATLLKTLLEDYLHETAGQFARSKVKCIESLTTYEIAETPINELGTERLLAHVRWRRQTVAPSTAMNDLTWIKTVLEHAKFVWGMEIDLVPIQDARTAARKARLIAKPNERDRRPTQEELDALRGWFDRTRIGPGRASTIPMTDVIDFAIASTRRQHEITRLRWEDLDPDKGICLLRDAKSPHGSKGNHRWFPLTREALSIIERQPRTSEYIFPYKGKTIGSYFTRACKLLGIKDLRFHDLRHEGTSRLFEAGYQIHEVQQFTLHDSWATLKRYTQLKPEDVALRDKKTP